MPRTSSLKTQWRVEWRYDRFHLFRKGGLYETRERARQEATYYRLKHGFGNSRVVKYVKGGAK